jgi:hypothetical protein
MVKKRQKDPVEIGRNDLCWCGSMKKYKYCHLNRSQEEPILPVIALKIHRQLFQKGYCLHAQADPHTCVMPIVKAHTIQRNGGLSQIALNGNVYSFATGHNLHHGVLAEAKVIGINQASTFNGFCKMHDEKTFEPIEKHPFQSTFLLAYRALCREIFLKRMAAEAMP